MVVKDLGKLAQKFVRNASNAAGDYKDGVAGPAALGRPHGEPRNRTTCRACKAAISRNAFGKGVRGAGARYVAAKRDEIGRHALRAGVQAPRVIGSRVRARRAGAQRPRAPAERSAALAAESGPRERRRDGARRVERRQVIRGRCIPLFANPCSHCRISCSSSRSARRRSWLVPLGGSRAVLRNLWPSERGGAAMELLTGIVTAPSTTQTALTMNVGNSLTIRNARSRARSSLLTAWADVQVRGILRIKSPKLHDNVQGIRSARTPTSCSRCSIRRSCSRSTRRTR
jgi:hypothetical protein